MKVIATIGPSGSGKTVWAKHVAFKRDDIALVDRNSIRGMLTGSQPFSGKLCKTHELIVTRLLHRAVMTNLRAGKDVIIHDTNLHIGGLDQLELTAELNNAEFFIKTFNGHALEYLTEINQERDPSVKVPTEVIAKQVKMADKLNLSKYNEISDNYPVV